MGRGPKKHLKRLNAPKHWMLDKLGGTWAPRPNTGPHKLRECLPLILLLRNRLKYALTKKEVTSICAQRHIKIDGKVRTDINYPTGFMDVVSIPQTNENFRLLYDTKGRFAIHRITADEAKYKLLKVRRVAVGMRGIPYMVTHDGRTIRYPDPFIKAGDSVRFNLVSQKVDEHLKFDSGVLAIVTSGRNLGRVGVIEHREKHMGGFDIVHLKDAAGHKFATRANNVFVIGRTTPHISLPRAKGVKLSIIEERERRLKKKKGGSGRKNKKKDAGAAKRSAKPAQSS
jgi:small subunit ribosomal protein S4e